MTAAVTPFHSPGVGEHGERAALFCAETRFS
jgi:hypothetical protein